MKTKTSYQLSAIILKFQVAILLALILSFNSCKKEPNSSVNNVSSNSTNNVLKSIPAFPLNWEPPTDYMPTPIGTPPIYVPWAGGAVKGFSPEIQYDYKKSDGWELVFNVFNTTSLQNNPYFVLYNKYKGVIRVYVYITTGGFINSSYLTSGINLGPNIKNSNMLNYIGKEIVDFNIKPVNVSQIEPSQMATGTWYALQYEIAYDPTITSSTYQELGMNWTLKWTDVTDVNLGGTVTGSMKGTITTPASGGFDLQSTLTKGALSTVGYSVFNNNKGDDPAKPGKDNKLGIPEVLFNSVSAYFTGNLGQLPIKFFSGIIGGGTSPKVENVSLTLNADIKLTGTLTNNGAIWPSPGLALGIPGTSNSQTATGFIPKFDNPMGIFYVSSKPNVIATSTAVQSTLPRTTIGTPLENFDPKITQITLTPYNPSGSDCPTKVWKHQVWVTNFVIDPGFQIVFNPSVLSVATITNIQKDILFLRPNQTIVGSSSGSMNDQSNYLSYLTSGTVTSIGNIQAYKYIGSVISPGAYYVRMVGFLLLPKPTFSAFNTKDNVAVRVSFTVNPINGAPSYTIVKTFLANVIQK